MRKETLEIIRNQNFFVEFEYLDKKDGKDFNINIEDFTVTWEVLYYNTDTEQTEELITSADYSLTDSILKNGLIAISMNAVQTGAIPEGVTSAPWVLYIENDSNNERYHLVEGTLRIIGWNIFDAN